MAALPAPFDSLPPVGVNDTLILWALLRTARGENGSSGGITVTVANGASFSIPTFDYQGFQYVGSTNNIQTQVFKSGGASGATVATLSYAYVGGGASDNDLISSITQS